MSLLLVAIVSNINVVVVLPVQKLQLLNTKHKNAVIAL